MTHLFFFLNHPTETCVLCGDSSNIWTCSWHILCGRNLCYWKHRCVERKTGTLIYIENFFYVCALRLIDTSILKRIEAHNKF